MEKRITGIILTILGCIALIVGGFTFINHTGNNYNIKVIVTSGILGLIFFSAGIGIIRNTKDTLKYDERVS